MNFRSVWNIFAVVILLFVVGTPFAMAQDATPSPDAVVSEVVVPVDEAPAPVSSGDSNSPAWYLLALGAVVFFASFAQYNLERMSGKSMRELSNSVPTHVVNLLLNGGQYLARLTTTTDADDKALLTVGGAMGYIPTKLADGSILWKPPVVAPPPPVETMGNIADFAEKKE